MDLRMNPGGLLSSAISIVDFFQDKGTIVSTKGRRLKEQTVNSATSFNTIVAKEVPIVVLIDNGSASASEIVSGALKDTKRGILVGDKSFGKGSVQTVIPLRDFGAMRITTARYYTPSGRSIQAKGIEPDIEVKPAKVEELESYALNISEAELNNALKNDSESETSKSKKDEKKKQDLEDYQLIRALDLVKALSLYSKSSEK